MRPTVLIDARNVLRSRWPNVPEQELVERCSDWAQAEKVAAVLVFDGNAPPPGAADDGCRVIGSGRESADDWITRAAAELAGSKPFWLVTSDRELRERAGGGAERVIGGGAFAAQLTG